MTKLRFLPRSDSGQRRYRLLFLLLAVHAVLVYAVPKNSDHFEITKFRLKPDQLHFGVGRERFAALIDPEFSRPSEADEWIRDSQL